MSDEPPQPNKEISSNTELRRDKDNYVSGFYEKISLSFLLGQMPPLKISIDQAFADMSLTNLKFLDDDLITV